MKATEWHLEASTKMAEMLFHRNVPQILLVHVGVFDAVMLETILKDLRAHRVKVVTHDQVLSDPVYKSNPNYAFPGGRTFLEQVAESGHVDIGMYDKDLYPVDKLNTVCTARQTAN